MRVLDRTPTADAEIRAAIEYLDRLSPPAAERPSDEVERASQRLLSNPFVGRDRSALRPGYRSVLVCDYLLFYRVTDAEVVVLRFLHGRRDLPAAIAAVDD
jgi:toxin ParE1/3/4